MKACEKLDHDLLKIDLYSRHPDVRPSIQENYGKDPKHKTVFILSHIVRTIEDECVDWELEKKLKLKDKNKDYSIDIANVYYVGEGIPQKDNDTNSVQSRVKLNDEQESYIFPGNKKNIDSAVKGVRKDGYACIAYLPRPMGESNISEFEQASTTIRDTIRNTLIQALNVLKPNRIIVLDSTHGYYKKKIHNEAFKDMMEGQDGIVSKAEIKLADKHPVIKYWRKKFSKDGVLSRIDYSIYAFMKEASESLKIISPKGAVYADKPVVLWPYTNRRLEILGQLASKHSKTSKSEHSIEYIADLANAIEHFYGEAFLDPLVKALIDEIRAYRTRFQWAKSKQK